MTEPGEEYAADDAVRYAAVVDTRIVQRFVSYLLAEDVREAALLVERCEREQLVGMVMTLGAGFMEDSRQQGRNDAEIAAVVDGWRGTAARLYFDEGSS